MSDRLSLRGRAEDWEKLLAKAMLEVPLSRFVYVPEHWRVATLYFNCNIYNIFRNRCMLANVDFVYFNAIFSP